MAARDHPRRSKESETDSGFRFLAVSLLSASALVTWVQLDVVGQGFAVDLLSGVLGFQSHVTTERLLDCLGSWSKIFRHGDVADRAPSEQGRHFFIRFAVVKEAEIKGHLSRFGPWVRDLFPCPDSFLCLTHPTGELLYVRTMSASLTRDLPGNFQSLIVSAVGMLENCPRSGPWPGCVVVSARDFDMECQE